MEKEEIDHEKEKNDNAETEKFDKDQLEGEKKEKVELTQEEKIKSLEDKLTRTLAEMENQRRRYEKEKEDAFEYGGFTFAKEALNIIDNIERAKQSLENDEKLKDSSVLKKALKHFEILNEHILSTFKKNNIEPIKSINEKLDPHLHQAMMEIEDENKDAGTIVQEIQKGFLIKDRLLRPSLVAVSKKIEKNDEIKGENNKKNKENHEKRKEN
tara:strand:+ start:68 stop:706 length:639 start_codon:yes stop_codon:yes gene_type:complete